MSQLSLPELLEACERGAVMRPYQRAVLLLSKRYPERELSELRDISIGELNRAMLAVHAELLGKELVIKEKCASCGELLESSIGVQDLLDSAVDKDKLSLSKDGYELQLRGPTTRDLEVSLDSGEDAEERLARRCVEAAYHNGEEIGAEDVPEYLLADVASSIAEAEPLTVIMLEMVCPECGGGWELEYDVADHLWNGIAGWASRTLDEVHLLASAYGWSESDILSLSPARRAQYIGRI